MATLSPFYDPPGAPILIPGLPGDVLAPWLAHRTRLRDFLAGLDDAAWAGPTRCTEWSVLDLVHHLSSVTLFFGATVHQAKKGEATRFLENFDPKTTPGAMVQMMSSVGPADSLRALEDADRQLSGELATLDDDGWLLPAEAPPGRVPVRVSLNHALFDSWIHERDIVVPMGTEPPCEPDEAEVVGRYILALAGGAAAGQRHGIVSPVVTADVRATDPDLRFGIDATGPIVTVVVGDAPVGAPLVQGRAADVFDVTTGREPVKPIDGSREALDLLGRFASILR